VKEKEAGLSRARLVSEALGLVQEEGLDALSMRGLADRLNVKAASLYWHVRDRGELLELLAESILGRVAPSTAAAWRPAVVSTAAALRAVVGSQRDANRILLEVPGSMTVSATHATLKRQLEGAGLPPGEASEVALMAMIYVIASAASIQHPPAEAGSIASIAIDSGSRGVLVRPGSDMQGLIRTARDGASAAPAIVHGERVVVRRLRGVGYGEIELNPRHPWRFQIQGATWNTVLEVGGLDVRAIKLDSGAAKVECFLPRPSGVVPIEVSGGVVGLSLHRPRGVAVAADISPGALRVKLDDYSLKAAVSDSKWESEEGASAAADRYHLSIKGGAVQVTLDSEAKAVDPVIAEVQVEATGKPVSALEILLDGVEKRISSLQTG
jgi:TetR/AcrR family tetracycline transcriptional repressor